MSTFRRLVATAYFSGVLLAQAVVYVVDRRRRRRLRWCLRQLERAQVSLPNRWKLAVLWVKESA